MGNIISYLKSFNSGTISLLRGMRITGLYFFRPKVTERYPENRATLKMADRFRGTLELIHNENNEHRCVGCGICETNCPNGTIIIKTVQVTTEEGKTKKVLDEYIYDLGSCTFCQLCVETCPHDALQFDQKFEHAVFTRTKLVQKLNNEGSKLASK